MSKRQIGRYIAFYYYSHGNTQAWCLAGSLFSITFNCYYSFGPNWWKVEMMMDCSKAFDSEGWFEFKSFVSYRGWENNINQVWIIILSVLQSIILWWFVYSCNV